MPQLFKPGKLCYTESMKKIVSLILIFVTALALAACGSRPHITIHEKEYYTQPAVEAAADDVVRPEIQAVFDEYENGMREYCDFMYRYNSSGNKPAMADELTEYATMINELGAYFTCSADWDLTEAERAYREEIQERVTRILVNSAAGID
ncbi:MAG: hypothetical protein IKR67_05910 [Lachnospiraceae bacterium]|nr:hypothetical protein [Lachnospiraceae bacterium]